MLIRSRLRHFGLWFLFWTILGVFFAHQLYSLPTQLLPQSPSWNWALYVNLPYYYLWGLFTPLVVLLARRFPLESPLRLRPILVHLAAAFLLSALQIVLFLYLICLANAILFPMPRKYTFLEELRFMFAGNFHMNLLTYAAIVAVWEGISFYRRARERQLAASQLETRLAQAHLQALRMQLHPHFLFNTLNAVSALVHSDPEAADRMIARLSDFLRLTLDAPASQEVPLRQELDFLRRYLAIEEVRFHDRLRVEIDAAPPTLDARVPYLLLQPLVENAIRHGIAPKASAGHLRIAAHRDAQSLHIDITDDGPGLCKEGEARNRKGLGLENTRARLERLHGAAFRLELENVPGGGCRTSLSIPFRPWELESDAPGPDRG